MTDVVSILRAAAAVLLECPEHVQIEGKTVLVNLHKRADEMKAIQYVPMRPVDCNQSEVYELMDRINVILDVPQEAE